MTTGHSRKCYFLSAEERKRQKMFSHTLLEDWVQYGVRPRTQDLSYPGLQGWVGSRLSELLFCLPRASLTCVQPAQPYWQKVPKLMQLRQCRAQNNVSCYAGHGDRSTHCSLNVLSNELISHHFFPSPSGWQKFPPWETGVWILFGQTHYRSRHIIAVDTYWKKVVLRTLFLFS